MLLHAIVHRACFQGNGPDLEDVDHRERELVETRAELHEEQLAHARTQRELNKMRMECRSSNSDDRDYIDLDDPALSGYSLLALSAHLCLSPCILSLCLLLPYFVAQLQGVVLSTVVSVLARPHVVTSNPYPSPNANPNSVLAGMHVRTSTLGALAGLLLDSARSGSILESQCTGLALFRATHAAIPCLRQLGRDIQGWRRREGREQQHL